MFVSTHTPFVQCCVQQELHRRYEGTPESTKTKALQTVIDMKVRIYLCVCVCLCVVFYDTMQ